MTTETLYVLAYFLWNLCHWFLWFTMMHHLFPCKLSRKVTYAIEMLSALADISLVYYVLIKPSPLRTSTVIVFFILPVMLLHRGTFLRKLIACLGIMVTLVCTELLCSFLNPSLVMRISERDIYAPICLFYYLFFLIVLTLLVFALYLLFRRWNGQVSGRLTTKEGWIFFLFPLSQFVLFTGWYMNYIPGFSPTQLIVSAVVIAFCALSDLLLFRMLRRTAENARLQAQNELLQEQIDAQSSYYQTLARNYSDMSKLRHDISNHIYTIQVLLQDNKKNEALQYAAELQQSEMVKSILSDCHNTVVGSFLRHKLDDLAAAGIEVVCQVSLPASTDVSDTDIIIALGNILDNTAEACRSVCDPRMELSLTYQEHFLRFDLTNSCPNETGKKERRIPYLERGLGSSILQSLSEKYHGTFTGYEDNGVYHTVLVLKE